jgi:hypothetical protein
VLAAVALAAPAPERAAAQTSRGYTVVRAPYRPVVRFAVTYTGAGRWHTDYHSEPPNPGGAHDTNDAHDTSTQRWSLRFQRPLVIGRCAAGRPAPAACPRVRGVSSATGTTRATGRIDHRHIDGLYRFDDSSERCRVTATTPAGVPLAAIVTARYVSGRADVALTALTPLGEVLALLPSACPSQGDSLDGLRDAYFMPGFSFADGFGSERWFTSRRVVIPMATLHRAARITFALGPTAHGTPPAGCAVPSPNERCHVAGAWGGTLTLMLKP